ncbi:class I SAM-dependent methyltransferase [Moheibacter sediminis]|uniref:Demethylmenaquinone methyltransferase / 2-methoxy-6-polyprenyl-1,4-benzoquinol methylase n=1 Tax=Moheibacter sediminis TaxID=1434700 RepID=A0A1W2BUU3_9FLAO|nr:class I SAM-dependent methyltransferase [Moheibacter sediminis]SMC76372.1 demethylmenaquinone methyltransferase / 2-methoxy-6-polyprenyl-1,4-benzoquinol methylase [Moheibacter sediminis]
MKDIYEPEFVKKLFDQMSASYERMNYITSFGFSIRWRKQFIQKIPATDDRIKVIDLLSGLGENWNYLRKRFPNAEFYALDFSDEMIEKSKKKNVEKFNNQFIVFNQNLLESDLDSNQFDVITCAYGLKTFNEIQLEQIAKVVTRILKQGGQFSFVEVSKPEQKKLHFFYSLYIGKIIPMLGKLFLGNPHDYKMLWIYTEKFQNAKRVIEIFEKENLKVNYNSYFFGCASGISGIKK